MRIKEYSLLNNEKSCGIRSYHSVLPPQRRQYNAHHHTECELSLFLHGKGIYTVGERKFDFCAGDIFLFGSNEEHCISEITEDIDLLNIQFEPYILWEGTSSTELLSLFNARNSSFENRYRDKTGEIARCITAFEEEVRLKRPCYELRAKCHLFMALTNIIRTYPYFDSEKAVRASAGITRGLRLAIDYIQENLESKLTLDDISRIACLSPTYFSHVFKKYNGITLWDYINIKRVEKAIEMLKSEKTTKLEIAESCGFSSSSNFYKIFTAVTGKKPNDYVQN